MHMHGLGADGADQNGNGDQGGVLQYSGGYANVTSEAYEAVPHTQTWQQCAAACASDGKCLAWTRVAGTARCKCPALDFWIFKGLLHSGPQCPPV